MTAVEALQAFCRAWFVERDVEAAMAFIREDVDFVGTGIGESARGRDEMLSYLRTGYAGDSGAVYTASDGDK